MIDKIKRAVQWLCDNIKKAVQWLQESNRWKHVIGGLLIGLCALGWYCALYTGVLVAAALELKDRQWGGKWDWIDLGLTVGGVVVGHLIRSVVS